MEAESGSKFDPSQWISNLLNYEAYLRLMALLFVLGLVAGLSYFVYSRAIYSSRALVKVSVFSTTTDEKGNQNTVPLYAVRRQLLDQLNARHVQAQAAVRAGFVSAGTSFAEMSEQAFPSIEVGVLDENFLEITTMSYFPEGVREYPKALMDQYLEKQEELRHQYREEAVARYSKELVDVRNKLDDKLAMKLKYEEDSSLAEVQIRQNQLSEVPVRLVWGRHRFEKMQELERVLEEKKDELDVIGKLSLLNSFEAEDPTEVGRMIRMKSDGSSPVQLQDTFARGFASQGTSTQVVVRPNMVEGLYPWQDLEKEQRQLEQRLQEEAGVYGPSHPVIVNIKSRLGEIGDRLNAEYEVALKRFSVEKSRLEEEIGELELKLPTYHEVTREYDQQRLDYDLLDKSELAWDQAHKRISAQIAGLEFGEGHKSTEMEFSGFAELRDENPVSPNKMKLMIMGIVLGLGMAVGVPFLIEMFDDTAATLQQLESVTGLTGIGVVPLTKREDLENIVRSPALGAKVPNFLLETFRVIRSNIILHPGRGGMSQVVMVTSACPGEGKTTQAANLAWAFSSMGEKTLLVDCDLRRGRQHALTGIENKAGMTALLTARATDAEVMQSVGMEDLTVIPRGPVIAGSTEILCQQRFADLMQEWRTKYDRIVMDTPPILGLSETVSLQRLADGVVVVVKAETTSRKDVVRAVELLKKGNAHFFGFVLNQIDLSRRSNYYNYYYYSAHYYDNFIDDEPGDKGLTVQTAGV